MRGQITFAITTTFLLVLCLHKTNAQVERWYVLKSIPTIYDTETKALINAVIEETGVSSMWFNGIKTSTFGVRSATDVDWVQVIHNLNSHGYFLSDITEGKEHHNGADASTSFYFQEAYYCSSHADACPTNYYAKLTLAEWNALPADVRTYYEQSGRYTLSD